MVHGTPPEPRDMVDEGLLVSRAQNYEDVRLHRALDQSGPRTYIDVGAGNPTRGSVTALLHEHGWHGINIEPGPEISALRIHRSGDVNLEVAISEIDGPVKFSVAHERPDLSALAEVIDESRRSAFGPLIDVEVTGRRLATVLDEYWDDQSIGVLKIDVEGAEAQVLGSNDWDRYQPVVVVVEAVDALTLEPNHELWEHILVELGYRFATFDGVNRFYVRDDRHELIPALASPVSAADRVVTYDLLAAEHRVATLLEERDLLLGRLIEIDGAGKELTVRHRALEADLHRLRSELAGTQNHAQHMHVQYEVAVTSNAYRAATVGKRLFKPVAYPVAPAGRLARSVKRRAKGRSTRRRDAYIAATAWGSPLASVAQPAPIRYDQATTPGVERIWDAFGARRRHHSLRLDDDELRLVADQVRPRHPNLDADYSLVVGADRLSQALDLHEAIETPFPPPRAGAMRDIVLVDARTLQTPPHTGVHRHSLAVLRSLLDHLPADRRMAMMTSELLGPVPDNVDAVFELEWDPADIGSVGAFVQLSPEITPWEDIDVDVLRADWILRVAIFYDDIVGHHPDHLMLDAWQFWNHQLAVEKLGRHHVVLALSESCAKEAARVLEGGDVEPEILVSGCISEPMEPTEVPPAVGLLDDYVVAMGNHIPHKNVAMSVAAIAPFSQRSNGPSLVVIATLGPESERALRSMAVDLGVPPSRVVVLGGLDRGALAATLAGARAVLVPSLHEGFSLPVVEAIGLGTPVAASDIAAHRELLGDGSWSFDPIDPISASDALGTVLADPEAVLAEQRRRLASSHDPRSLDRTISQVAERIANAVDLAPITPAPTALDLDKTLRSRTAATLPLELNKVCEIEDFEHPEMIGVLTEIFPHEFVRHGSDFLARRPFRKHWEIAMAVLAFGRAGLLDGTRVLCGIGAGNEPTIFHLTRRAKKVIATDLYDAPGWEESANRSMLENPAWHWPFAWNPDALEVRHMDALALDLDDESVDGVFSSSSIEHFGTHDDVGRALDEAYRVLRPGGVLTVSTEFRIDGPGPGVPGVLMFDADEVRDVLIGDRDWELMGTFDPTVSERTLEATSSFHRRRLEQDRRIAEVGALLNHLATFDDPHLVLSLRQWRFTSMHLALRKPS